jgi:putative pyruvate formate lyase activating enzyme
MHRQVGSLELGADGVARRGVLVRHLVMPGGLSDSEEVLGWIARELSPETYVNIMGQYRPAGRAEGLPPMDRAVTRAEVAAARRAAVEAGLTRLDGFGRGR